MKLDIEAFQRVQLAIAEWVDAWRIFPRIIVCMYMVLVYKVALWYMALDDHIIKGCVSPDVVDCIAQAPSNQHAALITTVIGFSAAIFGFYANSGNQKPVPPKRNPPPTDRGDGY